MALVCYAVASVPLYKTDLPLKTWTPAWELADDDFRHLIPTSKGTSTTELNQARVSVTRLLTRGGKEETEWVEWGNY